MKHAVPKLRCLRCGHEWWPRRSDVVQCPRCKSARWNEVPQPVTRKEKQRGNDEE